MAATGSAPEPPREATLLRTARLARGYNAGKAASRLAIKLSGSRWQQIERGNKGPDEPVVAPAATLAHMAAVVGITPEQLTDAGRGDAAEILREIPPVPDSGPPLQAVVTTTRLSDLVRERRAELGLTLEEVAARTLDPESDSVTPVWSVDDLAELEADDDPAPPRFRAIRSLAGALALKIRVVQDATSVQFHGVTVVWHPDLRKRLLVSDWEGLSDEQQQQLLRTLDSWGDT